MMKTSNLAWLLLAACGTVVGSRFVKSETVDAPTGAVVTVSAKESSALAGTKLEIPASALSATTTITIEPGLLSLVSGGEALSPVVEWGPSGLTFSKPATMTLPLNVSATDQASDLEVVVEDADGTVKAISDVTLDGSHTLVSFQVTGLSSYQVRRRHQPCTTTAQCPASQTCVAGTCRTTQVDGGMSGACVTNADCGSTQQCVRGTCVLRCTFSRGGCGVDGGPSDGGPSDGGPFDGGPFDGGPFDGGPFDGGPSPDAGPYDGGPSPDAGPYDGGPSPDAGPYDGGPSPDAGPFDGGPSPDAGPRDGGPSPDAGPFDGGQAPQQIGGTQIDGATKLLTWPLQGDADSYTLYVKVVAKPLGLITADERIVTTADLQFSNVTSPFSVAAFRTCGVSYFVALSASNAFGEGPLTQGVGFGPSPFDCDP